MDNKLTTALSRHQAGHLADAKQIYEEVLLEAPNNTVALHLLGVLCYQQGKLHQARELIENAIALQPDFAEAQNNLGLVLRDLGRADDAVVAFRRAVELRPDYADAYNNLGNVFTDLVRLEEAVASYRQALKLSPFYAEAHNNLGLALTFQGKASEGEAACRNALTLMPDFAEAYNNLSIALIDQDSPEDAEAACRSALELRPDFAAAHFQLAQVRQNLEPDDAQIVAMEALLDDPKTSESDRSVLQFALGTAYDKLGAYEQAFRHFVEANEFQRRRVAFDPEAASDLVNRIVAQFDRSFIDACGVVGDKSDVPIFVIGLPRSGKSLVERILAGHPKVHGAGERGDLRHIVNDLPQVLGTTCVYPELVADLTSEQAQMVGQEYVSALRNLVPDATPICIVNTTPSNALFVGLIHLVLPNARVIQCVRDPLDTCLYCYFQNFKDVSFAFSIEDLGEYFMIQQRLTDHWRNVLPRPPFEVSYDDLVRDPMTASRRIFEFCGLDWSEAYGADGNQDPSGNSGNADTFPIAFHDREIGRSRHYPEFVEALMRITTSSQ